MNVCASHPTFGKVLFTLVCGDAAAKRDRQDRNDYYCRSPFSAVYQCTSAQWEAPTESPREDHEQWEILQNSRVQSTFDTKIKSLLRYLMQICTSLQKQSSSVSGVWTIRSEIEKVKWLFRSISENVLHIEEMLRNVVEWALWCCSFANPGSWNNKETRTFKLYARLYVPYK